MEIVNTSKGCIPVVKTVEWNSQNTTEFIKTLKFFNFETGKVIKQIVVEQSQLTRNFINMEISLLQHGNSILFFKRDED